MLDSCFTGSLSHYALWSLSWIMQLNKVAKLTFDPTSHPLAVFSQERLICSVEELKQEANSCPSFPLWLLQIISIRCKFEVLTFAHRRACHAGLIMSTKLHNVWYKSQIFQRPTWVRFAKSLGVRNWVCVWGRWLQDCKHSKLCAGYENRTIFPQYWLGESPNRGNHNSS